jgi:hypothetical protein
MHVNLRANPPTGQEPGFVTLNPAERRRVLAVLAAAVSARRNCWWCSRPLVNGLCDECDAR